MGGYRGGDVKKGGDRRLPNRSPHMETRMDRSLEVHKTYTWHHRQPFFSLQDPNFTCNPTTCARTYLGNTWHMLTVCLRL